MDNIFEFEENTAKLMPTFNWLDELNPEQKQAVTTTEGPLLVLAGAGTGKTKVLTSRLAYVLANFKARPFECLVVTFTNRAANEMKERVHRMIGEAANDVWLGTFHGICAKMLRYHAEFVGLKSNFTILGEDDQKRLIKQILEAEGIDDKKYPPQAIMDKIQRWKDKSITADKINANEDNITIRVYKIYQQRLLELNCVDFGDILLHTLNILTTHHDILEKYQNKFKYIMVDEYQDTNITQYLFLRLLSQKHRNLCCVGDDDQSIYSWRGAEIENILRFEKDFPDAKIIRLERNYRSTEHILSAASKLIANNQGRLGKVLKVAENSPANYCDNSKIKVTSLYSGEEEARNIVEEIENNLRCGFQYSDMAILVRTAFQTREFEEKFVSEAIPYQVIGGLKFYERAEIKDALAYFRVLLQPEDDLAFERIINKPSRGVGAVTIDKLRLSAKQQHISMFNAAKTFSITGKAKNAIAELLQKFDNWRKELNIANADQIASMVLEESGYIDMLKSEKTPEAEGRIENLNELINVIGDKDKFQNLNEFMEHVSLVMDKDNNASDNRVLLITLHSAKGLEFDVVFLPGWEEGLFPHQRALDESGSEGLEEERRLAYVALTRAKKKLYISTALNRRLYGQWQNNMPSRFINELPPHNIEIVNKTGFAPTYNGNNPKSKIQNPKFNASSDEHEYYDEEDLIGKKVFHQTFGYGLIRKIEGNKLGIYFFKEGFKMVMSNYVKLV